MRPLRRALTRLYDGSGPLFWQVLRALVGARRADTLLHLVLVGAGVWVWWRLMEVWPLLTGVLAAGWCLFAWQGAEEEAHEEEQQAAAAEAQQDAAEERQVLLDELYLRLVLRTIGDRTGVHLSELLPVFQRSDPGRLEYATAQDLRVLLAALGVPVQRKIRVGRRTGVPGVRAEDARAALERYLARGPSPLA